MLELTGTALLAISTPLDEFNYYSKLVEQKDDDGNLFFNTFKAGRICEDCGLLPHEQMIKCNHVKDGAHWKSSHRLKRLKCLYDGDEARGLRELGGIPATAFTACFQKKDIDTLFANPRYTTEAMPDCLYITVDPNGGGASKMGMASGYFYENNLVITGLEAESVPSHAQQQALIRRHISRLRQNPLFLNCPIWVIPENNLGLESSHIESYLGGVPNVYVYHEDGDARAGVRKTHQNTEDYQICVESMLRKRQMMFERELFTTSSAHIRVDGNTRSITDELRQQLERYHWETQEAKDAFGKRRITMTGKMGGAQDDLYVATAMLAFWGKVHQIQSRAGVNVA